MTYKRHKIIGIRKVKWDQLWHILYLVNGKITWDRVSRDKALKVGGSHGNVCYSLK